MRSENFGVVILGGGNAGIGVTGHVRRTVMSVAMIEKAAANQKGFAIKVHSNDMHDWFSARTYAETVAWSKIIVDETTDYILGAHFVGHAGEELVNIFGPAMRFGITATQIKDTVCAYPTFSSDIKHILLRSQPHRIQLR